MTIRYDRLEQLATFLYRLDDKAFCFASICEAHNATEPECGTVACAIGWTPRVFPDLVGWVQVQDFCKGPSKWSVSALDAELAPSPNDALMVGRVAQALFGFERGCPTESDWVEGLFVPAVYRPWDPNDTLGFGATPSAVARNIRDFITWHQAGAKDPRDE